MSIRSGMAGSRSGGMRQAAKGGGLYTAIGVGAIGELPDGGRGD
ncbi:MAG: hypothetical protein WAO08_33945 [Hyphomicrobiaceae bacterium]